MNVERLLEFLQEILELENNQAIQRKLSKLDGAIQTIMNNPQDANQQTSARDRISELRSALTTFADELSPAAQRFLEEKNYDWAFQPSLADQVDEAMNKNAMTPAVVKRQTEKRVGERQKLIELFTKTRDDLSAMKFRPEHLEPGEAQLGFTIPRELFQNTLEGLAKELKGIDRAIGIISEAVEGEREHATVAQLSTSDPLILVAANAPVVLAVGYAIKFFIARWTEVEHIRKVRAETRALNIANDAVLKPFDDHIKTRTLDAIEEQIRKLLPDASDGRDRELVTGLRWALKYLMSRVEAGMTMEVKFLPPKAAAPTPGDVGAVEALPYEEHRLYQDLADVKKALMFNTLDVSDPLLKLEGPMSADNDEKPTVRRPARGRKKKKDGEK